MTTNIPEISPALREWTEKLALNHGSAVNRVYAALMSIKPYADQDSPTKLDTRNSIIWSVKLWFDTLLSGSAPSEEELEAFREFGRRRVYQGVPLDVLLRAFRLGSRELWCFYTELDEKSDPLRDGMQTHFSKSKQSLAHVPQRIVSTSQGARLARLEA